MSREYPTNPLPGVLAVVVRQGRVLLVKRGCNPNKGLWGFPGGLVELGETAAEAAIRELAEETGIAAEAGGVLEVLDSISRDDEGRVRFHFLLVAVLCRWTGGEPSPADDADETGWFTPDDIAALPCVPQLTRLAALAVSNDFWNE
jgi:8-oxo-dGTP diphosphatase